MVANLVLLTVVTLSVILVFCLPSVDSWESWDSAEVNAPPLPQVSIVHVEEQSVLAIPPSEEGN